MCWCECCRGSKRTKGSSRRTTARKPHDHCWHLGCILRSATAVFVRTGEAEEEEATPMLEMRRPAARRHGTGEGRAAAEERTRIARQGKLKAKAIR